MAVNLTKNSIELGIRTMNPDEMLAFYRDTLGLPYQTKLDIPNGDIMHRLQCGDCIIKLVKPKEPPSAEAAPGGIPGATGYRYFTMYISNIGEVLDEVRKAGYKVAVPETELFPGVSIAIVEDPDGNWVEFLCQKS
jgi:catechol 2,3-dioxygenase-like lactoylglutathione lyase family enzyme